MKTFEYLFTEREVLASRLRPALDKLTERERLVIEAKFYDGRNFSDIASQCGVTSGRVTQIYHKALRRCAYFIRQKEFRDGILEQQEMFQYEPVKQEGTDAPQYTNFEHLLRVLRHQTGQQFYKLCVDAFEAMKHRDYGLAMAKINESTAFCDTIGYTEVSYCMGKLLLKLSIESPQPPTLVYCDICDNLIGCFDFGEEEGVVGHFYCYNHTTSEPRHLLALRARKQRCGYAALADFDSPPKS